MRIGIDLDGVVYDTEKDFRIYQELYDIYILKNNTKKDENEIKMEERFDWSQEITTDFFDRYVGPIIREANYMPGAKMILKMLKEEGHELIIVSARGEKYTNLIPVTEERLKKDGMFDLFDKHFYSVGDKAKVCKEENIDIMIDDSNHVCKNTSENKIETIYLKDAPSCEMKENKYLKVLYNWGEIYRYIREKQNS